MTSWRGDSPYRHKDEKTSFHPKVNKYLLSILLSLIIFENGKGKNVENYSFFLVGVDGVWVALFSSFEYCTHHANKNHQLWKSTTWKKDHWIYSEPRELKNHLTIDPPTVK